MSQNSSAQPRLLSRLNERSVLRVLQRQGPCSRAEVTRYMDVTAPTVSKAVASLLRAGLLEEFDIEENGRGRPAKKLRVATETAQVLGLVIDAGHCRLVSAGMDGLLRTQSEIRFATPDSYERFLDQVSGHVKSLADRNGVKTLGLGISMPGLIDYRNQQGLLSPNVPMTNGHSPSCDLSQRLGLDCVVWHETDALCLAERRYGGARGLEDFAMLDMTTGVGLGVMSGGRLLTGHSGLAGEIGHIPVDPDGRPCGCGGRGCLETVASDSSLAWSVSQRVGRVLTVDAMIQQVRAGALEVTNEASEACRALALGLATVINLFNPSTLFVYGRLFELDDDLFPLLLEETKRRSLGPSFADCSIVRARGCKREGAIAGIIEFLTDSLVPALATQANVLCSRHGNGRHAARQIVTGLGLEG